eukprot:1150868-Pelagomonas_calceolata.AAC.5
MHTHTHTYTHTNTHTQTQALARVSHFVPGNKPPGVSRPLPASLTDALAEGRPSSHEDTEAAAAPVRGPPSVALKRMLAHSGEEERGNLCQ